MKGEASHSPDQGNRSWQVSLKEAPAQRKVGDLKSIRKNGKKRHKSQIRQKEVPGELCAEGRAAMGGLCNQSRGLGDGSAAQARSPGIRP